MVRLYEAYGADPYDAGFPWDNLDFEALAPTLTYELDLDRDEVVSLLNCIRGDAWGQADLRRRMEAPAPDPDE